MTLFKKEAYFHTLAAVSQGTGFYFSTYKQTDWKTLQRPIIQWYEARNKLQEGNHNYVKIKQHATTQPMCWRRNQVRRQKISWDKWKRKYNILNMWDWASQVVLVVKNLPANAGDIRNVSLIPGSGRSPGGGHVNPLQYSCLENPMDRGAWQTTVHRVQKSQTLMKQLSMDTNI